jgi:uncharacterized protein
MTLEEKKSASKYRLERAFETIEEAKILAEKNRWNTTANRLYYASFYAISALLVISYENSPITHAGVKTMFNNDFVRTGKVPRELGLFYNRIFSKRKDGDYEDFIVFTEQDIAPIIQQTEIFVETIENLIAQQTIQSNE